MRISFSGNTINVKAGANQHIATLTTTSTSLLRKIARPAGATTDELRSCIRPWSRPAAVRQAVARLRMQLNKQNVQMQIVTVRIGNKTFYRTLFL